MPPMAAYANGSLLRLAFVGYEHLVTLGEEIRLFWGGKFSGATVLFLLNRYSNLIFVFFEMISCFIHFSDTVSPFSVLCSRIVINWSTQRSSYFVNSLPKRCS